MANQRDKNKQEISIQQIYQSFFTPLPYTPALFEQSILDRAVSSRLPGPSGELAVSTWGDNNPEVLLVHGWGGTRAQMTGLVEPLLAAGYRVVAFDLPAHGDSQGTITNVFEMAAAMTAIAPMLDHLHGIISHSFGTLVTSYTLAQKDFPLPSKLIYFGAFNRLMDTLPRFQMLTQLPDRVIDALRDILYKKYGQNVMESVVNASLISNLSIPTLMFHDANDTVTPVTDSRAIARSNSHVRLMEMVNMGHTGALRSGEVHKHIMDFLKET